MKRTVLLPLTALLIIAAVLAGGYLAQTHPMAARIQKLEAELSKAHSDYARLKVDHDKALAANVLTSAAQNHKERQITTQKPLASPPGTSGKATEGASTTSTSGATSTTSESTAKRNVVDLPQLQSILDKANDRQIDTVFGRLFKQFALSDQEQDHFRKLLADRQSLQTAVIMKQMDSSLTPEQLKAVRSSNSAEIAAAKKESDAAIRQFLNNDEDFETFKQWDDTRYERSTLQRAVGKFDAAGEPLTPEQRDQLLNVMVSVRKASPPVVASRTPPPPGTNPGSAYQARVAADNEKILQQAASFLSATQLGVLKREQDHFRALTQP